MCRRSIVMVMMMTNVVDDNPLVYTYPTDPWISFFYFIILDSLRVPSWRTFYRRRRHTLKSCRVVRFLLHFSQFKQYFAFCSGREHISAIRQCCCGWLNRIVLWGHRTITGMGDEMRCETELRHGHMTQIAVMQTEQLITMNLLRDMLECLNSS